MRLGPWLGSAMLLSACASGDGAAGLSGFLTSGQATESAPDDGMDAATESGGGTTGAGDTTMGGRAGSGAIDSTSDDDAGEVDDGSSSDETQGADADAGESSGTDSGCVPAPEECDGIDNDCDDEIDEDFGLGNACVTAMPGVCSQGTNACDSTGSVACTPDTPASAESCNGLDDDCDGMVDNDVVGVGGACNTGLLGVCAGGTQVCDDVGMILVCQPDVTASAESCNNLDDDCNGTVDDGLAGVGDACSTGLLGVCAAGTTTCNGALGTISCVQDVAAAGAEVCGNSLDDDCNGTVDDGCPCEHELCETGVSLVAGCDPCVASICAVDSFCCNNSWDGICVGRVETTCGSAECVDPDCEHLVCETGDALTSTCHPCVTTICGLDAFCCSTSWDGICVGRVTSDCMLDCPP